MKKYGIRKIILIGLISVLCTQSSVGLVGSVEGDINYSYNYGEYDTEILDYKIDDDFIYSDFEEKGESISLEIDKDMQYVKLNGVYYDFEDYNLGLAKQASDLYDNGISKTIVEEMKSYPPIQNIDMYVEKKTSDTLNLKTEFNRSIAPQASYGTFYYKGEYKKVNIALSLTSGAILVAWGFLTGGLTGIFTTAAVKTFISSFLRAIGKNFLTTILYYKKWQAILNSRGTTTERRQAGALREDGKTKFWDTKKYDRTFETQRPV